MHHYPICLKDKCLICVLHKCEQMWQISYLDQICPTFISFQICFFIQWKFLLFLMYIAWGVNLWGLVCLQDHGWPCRTWRALLSLSGFGESPILGQIQEFFTNCASSAPFPACQSVWFFLLRITLLVPTALLVDKQLAIARNTSWKTSSVC